MLKAQPDPERAAEGIIIGGGDAGPLYGTGLRVINMDDPKKIHARPVQFRKSLAVRMLARHWSTFSMFRMTSKKRQGSSKKRFRLHRITESGSPAPGLANSCKIAAEMVTSGVPCPVIKISIGGFDTHNNQLNRHSRLLTELADGLLPCARH